MNITDHVFEKPKSLGSQGVLPRRLRIIMLLGAWRLHEQRPIINYRPVSKTRAISLLALGAFMNNDLLSIIDLSQKLGPALPLVGAPVAATGSYRQIAPCQSGAAVCATQQDGCSGRTRYLDGSAATRNEDRCDLDRISAKHSGLASNASSTA